MSLEHFISVSSRLRHETASHPFVLFLTLFAIIRILGFGYRRHSSNDAGNARPILLTLTTLTLGVYLALVCWYLAQEHLHATAQ